MCDYFLYSLHSLYSLFTIGLAVPVVGVNAFATARDLIDKMVTVSEQAVALAILRLVEQEKAVIEGAGAVGVAAILDNKLPELQGKRLVLYPVS